MKTTLVALFVAVLTACGGSASSSAPIDTPPASIDTPTSPPPSGPVPVVPVQPIDPVTIPCAPSGAWDVTDARAAYTGAFCASTELQYTAVVTLACTGTACTWTETAGTASATLDTSTCTLTMVTHDTLDTGTETAALTFTRTLTFEGGTATGTFVEADVPSVSAACTATYNTTAARR